MVRLLVGDARAELATLEAESVHTVVTSPPYWGLRAYGTTPQVWGGEEDCLHEWGEQEPHGRRGKRGISGTGGNLHPTLDATGQGAGSGGGGAWCQGCGAWRGELGAEPTPELFVEHLVGIFREVKRVLRPDGTLWLNMGDCYNAYNGNRGDTGSTLEGRRQHLVNRPKLASGAGLSAPSLKNKDLVGMPWLLAFALRADGWYLRSDIIWAKGNPMPASVTDRPTTSHEYLFLLTKQPRYYYDATAIREKGVCPKGTRGAKGSVTRAAAGVNARPPEYKIYNGTRNKRSVWTINTAGSGIPHYATFPAALVRPCVLAGTSEKGCCEKCGSPWERVVEKGDLVPTSRDYDRKAYGTSAATDHGDVQGLNRARDGHRSKMAYENKTTGWQPTCSCNAAVVPCTILDPFGGVGTTAAVAHLLGRDAISIDLDPASLTHYPTRLAALSKLAKPKRVPQEQRTLPAMEDAP